MFSHLKYLALFLFSGLFIAYGVSLYVKSNKVVPNVTVVLPDTSQHGVPAPAIAHLPQVIKKVHGRKNTAVVSKTQVETYTFKDSTVSIKIREIPYESKPYIYNNGTHGIGIVVRQLGFTFYPYITVLYPNTSIGLNTRLLYFHRWGLFIGVSLKKSAFIGLDYRTTFLNNRLLIGAGIGVNAAGQKVFTISVGF